MAMSKNEIDLSQVKKIIQRESEQKGDPLKVLQTSQKLRLGEKYKEQFKLNDGNIITIRAITKIEATYSQFMSWESIADTEAFKRIYPFIKKRQFNKEINLTPAEELVFARAGLVDDQWTVYYAIKDFHDLKPEEVSRLDDIFAIAKRVREISGLSEDSAKEVESFR